MVDCLEMFNVSTDLDMVNGTRGHTVVVVLGMKERGSAGGRNQCVIAVCSSLCACAGELGRPVHSMGWDQRSSGGTTDHDIH